MISAEVSSTGPLPCLLVSVVVVDADDPVELVVEQRAADIQLFAELVVGEVRIGVQHRAQWRAGPVVDEAAVIAAVGHHVLDVQTDRQSSTRTVLATPHESTLFSGSKLIPVLRSLNVA